MDDNGLTFDTGGAVTGVANPFRFSLDPNTPNDHIIPFLLTMTASNGLDPGDPAIYEVTHRNWDLKMRLDEKILTLHNGAHY